MEFNKYLKEYVCSSEHNNALHAHFTKMTDSTDFLSEHRNYIEKYKLGFGDRAFHYMWSLIIEHLVKQKKEPSLLEIGVYKGQVISLWSLLSKKFNAKVSISGISPLSGNVSPASPLIFYWKYLTDSKFRKDAKAGNFYNNEDYRQIISDLFNAFELDFSNVVLLKGYSTDQNILKKIDQSVYDLIYIDGDHTREIAEQDIRNYSIKIMKGGFLVMDDASCNIPGGEEGQYWKGHQPVSDACEILPSLGFVNILNIGHNRVYQKK